MMRHSLRLIFDNCCRAVALATLPRIPSEPDTPIQIPVHVAGHGPDTSCRRRSSYVARAPSGRSASSPETTHPFQFGPRRRLEMTSYGASRNSHEK